MLLATAKVGRMKFTDWLDEERGRTKQVADHFGITQGAVSQWRADGVPLARMREVRDLSGGAVSLEDMLPPVAEAA